MADFISSRPVDESRDNQEHLVKEMIAIQRVGGAKEMRATIDGGYVWLEGWRESPADPVTGDWPAFEPAYTLETSRGS